MKNYLLAVAGVFVAGVLQAGNDNMQAPSSDLVTLIDPGFTFEISFDGLALQGFANNLDYAAEAIPFFYGDAQPAVSPSWYIPQISPDFHFGFNLGAGVVFHETRSSLMANWEWFHTSNDSDTFVVPIINDMIGPFFEIGPDASLYKQANGTTNYRFDEVNLDFGTFVGFGPRLKTNLFSGISFLRLVQNRYTWFADFASTVIRTLTVPAKFTGGGIQTGFDFCYDMGKGFHFAGNALGTLFVGIFQNSTTFTTQSNALVTLGDQNPNVQKTSTENKTGIVPALQGKLGFGYNTPFRCHYFFAIEAGYEAEVYINAIRSIDMGSEVALGSIGSIGSASVGVYARSFERLVSDFCMAGPYANIRFGF